MKEKDKITAVVTSAVTAYLHAEKKAAGAVSLLSQNRNRLAAVISAAVTAFMQAEEAVSQKN